MNSSSLTAGVKLIFLFSVYLFLSNCKSNRLSANNIKTSDTIERFDSFFKKFQSDSVFQLARVKFPLKIKYESEITNGSKDDSTRFLKKGEWQYYSFGKNKNADTIFKRKRVNKGLINMELTVQETGILVNHYFVLENGKWKLGYIVDDSD